jgi:dienelactone hydrolase
MKIANIPAALITVLAGSLVSAAVCAADLTELSPGGSGHYPAVMVTDPTLPTHTIYRPADLKGLGTEQLPIVAWGNGGCSNVGDSAKNFLLEVASHGFLVIAVGLPGKPQPTGGVSTAEPRERGPRTQTRSAQLLDALDWAVAQNARAGSDYFGHLNTKQTAVMGHSCGGLQALEVSSDPRVSTSVILDSGILIDPPPFPMPGVVTNDKSELARLHAPLIYIIGGPTDIAYSNAADDFKRIDRVAVFMANTNVGHKGTFAEPNGGIFAQVTSAWLQWRLKHDQAAAKMFVGPQCGLCTDSAWTVQKSRIDEP